MSNLPSINDQAIDALSMISTMDEGMSNDDPERHIIRNMKRMATRCVTDGFQQAIELAFQARDVRKTFSDLKELRNDDKN